MTKSTSLYLVCLTAVALVLTSAVATAQPGPRGQWSDGPGWGPGMMMGPGMMGGGGFSFMCNPRAAGFAEWRIARIEAAVRPTEAQRGALDELRAASSKAVDTISAACTADFPAKSTERLAAMEKRVEAMLQAIKTVRPAFDAFYAALDDQQKARLDDIGPRRWGWRGWRWSWGG
jgi:LTXXQ motif family protein